MAVRIINNIICIDPEIVSGTPVFVGTRVPVYILFDYLKGGHSVAEFLEDFPSVTLEQVNIALHTASKLLLDAEMLK
jgi:uncharacterized protein (DUF433 family)